METRPRLKALVVFLILSGAASSPSFQTDTSSPPAVKISPETSSPETPVRFSEPPSSLSSSSRWSELSSDANVEVSTLLAALPSDVSEPIFPVPEFICETIEELNCQLYNSSNDLTNRWVSGSGGRCFCDAQCATFGDCCESHGLPPADRSVKCINLPFMMREERYVGIYAKNFCPDGKLCSSSSDDPFTLLPAFGNKSQMAYRNVFCALCNNENFDELIFGEVAFSCEPGFDSNRIVGNKLRFFAGSEPDPLGVRKSCSLSYFFPSEISESVVKCIPSIDTCPADTSRNLADMCESYMGTVFNGEEKLYKNRHCAECHGVKLDLLVYSDCVSPFQAGGISEIGNGPIFTGKSPLMMISKQTIGYSMTIFLDLNIDDGNIVGTTKRCEEGQVFDPWMNFCRQVVCVNGQQFFRGKCRSRNILVESTRSSRNATVIIVNGTEESLPIQQVFNYTREDLKQEFSLEGNISAKNCPRIQFLASQYQIVGSLLYVNSSERWFNLSDVTFDGLIAAVCLTDEYDQYVKSFAESEIILSVVCFALSLICLCMHFAVYILAGKYRLVPDLNMLSISLAIFCVQIFFLVAPLAQRFQLLDSVFCAIIGILLHYCILSSFTWSSVIAYDITKSVLSLEHPSFATVTYSHYIRYSLFAWLTAGIPVVTGLIFDATMPDSDYSPVYGRHVCYVGRRKSLWVLFGAPVTLLLTVNLVLYIITASALWKSHRQRRALQTSKDKSNQSPSSQYRLYVKLAMIMGLAWVTGFLAIAVPALRYVNIVANGLQGLYIFWAFSCKRSILKTVAQKRRGLGTVFDRLNSLGSKKSSLSTVSSLSTGKLTGKTSNTKSTSSQEAYVIDKAAIQNEDNFLNSLYPDRRALYTDRQTDATIL